MRRQKDVQNKRKKMKHDSNIISQSRIFPFVGDNIQPTETKQEEKSVSCLDPVLKKKSETARS